MILEGLGAVAALGSGALSLGVFHPRVPMFGPVRWHGRREGNRVALSFDDGPHPQFTAQVAQALEQAGARATFFCVGRHLQAHADLARLLLRAGHELCNHTYSHGVGIDLFSQSRLQSDLERCQKTLEDLTGHNCTLYRPAVGIKNPVVHRAAASLGLEVVTWSDAARDGAFPLTEARARQMGLKARAGDILALHDGVLHGGQVFKREATVRHLPALLDTLKARGFELCRVSDVL